jgi:hypothetical protein
VCLTDFQDYTALPIVRTIPTEKHWIEHRNLLVYENTDQPGSVMQSTNGLMKCLSLTLGIRSVDQMIRKQRLSIKKRFPSIQEGRRGKTTSLLARAIEIGEPEIYPPRNLQMFFLGWVRGTYQDSSGPLRLRRGWELYLSCCYKIPCGLCCSETMSNKTTWSMIQRPSSNSAQDDKRPWSQARSVEPLQP